MSNRITAVMVSFIAAAKFLAISVYVATGIHPVVAFSRYLNLSYGGYG